MIVILNGTSSSGKTTLAKALQDTIDRPFLVVGIDTMVFALPRRYLNEQWSEVFRYEYDGDRITDITPAAFGDQLAHGLHTAIAALAGAGIDLIVDHVVLAESWAADLRKALSGLDVLTVGVTCPLDVVEERERSRKDRTLGQARAQFGKVHEYLAYDLTVDTSTASPSHCAAQVAAAVAERYPV